MAISVVCFVAGWMFIVRNGIFMRVCPHEFQAIHLLFHCKLKFVTPSLASHESESDRDEISRTSCLPFQQNRSSVQRNTLTR